MAYSEIEKEIIFLKAVQELIDEMVNHEVLNLIGKDPHSEIRFKSSTHQRFFNIILVDFLSLSDKNVMGEKLSYLGAVRKICANPHFNVDGSVDALAAASQEFTEWLDQDAEVEVWLPSTEIETTLSIKRIEFLKICGNISKHNFSRLSGVVRELIEVFGRNNIKISVEEALLILNEFYERFHDDILNYHGSTIAEFLNNIRWGIHKYLKPEFSQSIIHEGGAPPKYRYTYPADVEGKFARNTYWQLMNKIRSSPYVKEFKVTRYLKLRY
jgi:hypothetical protein